jgi:hypothetical protein
VTRSSAEYHLTVAVANYLRHAVDIPWSHFPAGEQRDPRTGAKLKQMGLQPGWPDFVFILPNGVFGGIELKADRGVPSLNQKAFRDACNRVGGLYSVCNTINAVERTLDLWGVPLKARAA